VREGDAAIDALDEQINEEAARIIAQRQPIASDLRLVLSVFRISSNLERIGDYAKNIAKRSEAIMDHPPVNGTGRFAPAHGAAGGTDAQGRARRLYPARRRTWRSTCATATSRSTRCIPRCSANT
jgi:hypothetical protein